MIREVREELEYLAIKMLSLIICNNEMDGII
jgi:hypothetical protein